MLREYNHFIKDFWPWLLFGVITVFWGNFGQSFFISWFGADFQESLGLTATDYGVAYSLATLASGLLIMWAGGAIDRVSVEKFVIFCGAGLSGACLILWQSNTLFSLTCGLFMLRFFGQGLLPHTAITTMMKQFSHNRGKAISVATTGVPLGEIILPTLAVLIIGFWGWQKSWLLVAFTVPILFLPLALWLVKQGEKEKYQEVSEKQQPQTTSLKPADGNRYTLLHDYRFWLALPAILSSPFIVTGIFIHQGFILAEMQWTPKLFAQCFVFYGVSHWYFSMYAGSLVDRFSGVKLLKFFPIPLACSLLVPVLLHNQLAAFMFLIGLGMSIGASNPIVNAVWAEVYGTRFLGGIRALVTSFMVISTSVSPVLFGFLIDHKLSLNALLIGLSGYVFFSILLVSFSYSPPKEI